MAMSLVVSSSESLSLTITGDSASLFRKAYLSPEGKDFSSIVGYYGFSVLGSSTVLLESSFASMTSPNFPSISSSRSKSEDS